LTKKSDIDNKYDQNYENKIVLLAQEERLEKGKYKVFDNDARVITRRDFPELVRKGKTDVESCLIIANSHGETIVITKEFSRILFNSLRSEN